MVYLNSLLQNAAGYSNKLLCSNHLRCCTKLFISGENKFYKYCSSRIYDFSDIYRSLEPEWWILL